MEASASRQARWSWAKASIELAPGKPTAATPLRWEHAYTDMARVMETLSATVEELANEKKVQAGLRKELAEAKTGQEPTSLSSPTLP